MTPQVAAIFDALVTIVTPTRRVGRGTRNVAPVSWFVIDHVNHGRRHLNFSDWGRYTSRDVDGMLKEICQEVKAGQMPLSSYTPLHPGSTLSTEDVKVLCDWTNAERIRIAAQ